MTCLRLPLHYNWHLRCSIHSFTYCSPPSVSTSLTGSGSGKEGATFLLVPWPREGGKASFILWNDYLTLKTLNILPVSVGKYYHCWSRPKNKLSNKFTWHRTESCNAKKLNLAFKFSIDVLGNLIRYGKQTGLKLCFDIISGYSPSYIVNWIVIWFGLSSPTTLVLHNRPSTLGCL